MAESPATPRSLAKGTQQFWVFLLLGFTGGGLGALLALLVGVTSWPEAKLFIVPGIAVGIAFAAVLLPHLPTTKVSEAGASRGDSIS